jgi:hypothetical protein
MLGVWGGAAEFILLLKSTGRLCADFNILNFESLTLWTVKVLSLLPFLWKLLYRCSSCSNVPVPLSFFLRTDWSLSEELFCHLIHLNFSSIYLLPLQLL